ncbi:MAG: metalloregulator ArsR/SmtB family transcription factor [Pyrinomonadaceae bacterium]
MDNQTIAALESLYLALADKTRLKLLSLMANGEVSVGYLADELGESQPKISRHLAYLRNAGLVSTRRDGKWVYYAVEPQELAVVNGALESALAVLCGRSSDSENPDRSSANSTQPEYLGAASGSHFEPEDLPVHLL